MLKRMKFIPELREKIKESVPLPEHIVENALEQWDKGGDSRTPMEAGMFEVFKQVQLDIENIE